MKKIIILLIIIFTSSSLAFAEEKVKNNDEPLEVSMINLIATPEKYDGKKVSFSGFGLFTGISEDDGIYLSENDAKRFIFNNAIRVVTYLPTETHPDINKKIINECHLKYIKVTGTFGMHKRGTQLATFAGTLIKIESVSILPDHSNEEKYKKYFGETTEMPEGAKELNFQFKDLGEIR